MSGIEVTRTTIENMHQDWAPGPSGRGFWNILDDYNSTATFFCVNGRNFLSHNLFTSSANIFPSDYVRAEDSDTSPLIRLITYPCDQNVKEITDAYGYFVLFDLVPGLVSANCFSLADKWHFDATINISQVRFRLHRDGKRISRLLIIISCEPWLCNSFPNSSYLNALHSTDCLWFHSVRFYRPRARGCRHDISQSCNP